MAPSDIKIGDGFRFTTWAGDVVTRVVEAASNHRVELSNAAPMHREWSKVVLADYVRDGRFEYVPAGAA